MKNLYKKLTYYPVNIRSDRKAFSLHGICLTNAIRPVPEKDRKILIEKENASDSGGLQVITLGTDKRKTVLFGPMYKTDTKDSDFLTIGLLSICQEYRRLNSSIGFHLDIPSGPDDNDYDYYYKLEKSIEARNTIMELAPAVCPETRLGIVLHPRYPFEVEGYFSLIATPTVHIYAYPPGNKSKDALANAFILSFLHSVGVRHVHFLGSSAVPVIILLAKALTLRMFESCSFDSLTWNQQAVGKGYRLLDPITLASTPSKSALDRLANLRWKLTRHGDFLRKLEARYDLPEWPPAGEWLGLININSIEYFKNSVLKTMAMSIGNNSLANIPVKRGKQDIGAALMLLKESKIKGHDFIKEKYQNVSGR